MIKGAGPPPRDVRVAFANPREQTTVILPARRPQDLARCVYDLAQSGFLPDRLLCITPEGAGKLVQDGAAALLADECARHRDSTLGPAIRFIVDLVRIVPTNVNPETYCEKNPRMVLGLPVWWNDPNAAPIVSTGISGRA